MTDRPLILVTNDDGYDSTGLHALAKAMSELGEVVVVAPDSEYSGAGAAIGAIWENPPEVHEVSIEGATKAWSVAGAPALCVLYARLGAFGRVPDLIVSGINPGVNVGRSVYHSGTVGAVLTGRNGDVSGLAVSLGVADFGVEGQAWGDVVSDLDWSIPATIALEAARSMLANPTEEPMVLNINVPNSAKLDSLEWEWSEVGASPPRAMTSVKLIPKPGHKGSFNVVFKVGDTPDHPLGTDTRAILDGKVSFSWLGRITAIRGDSAGIDANLSTL